MQDIIIVAIVAGIVIAAAAYIYRAKKKGATCIGCPHSKTCAARKSGSTCGCGDHTK